MAGLVKEIFQKEIVGGLYKGNEFMNKAVNADKYVKEGTYVNIPQAGAGSNVEVDRAALPAPITERTDTNVLYQLKEFTSDPKLIKELDKIQYEYDKLQSLLAEDLATIKQKVADWMLRLWTPAAAATILRTTGANVTASAPAATGLRKGFVKEDLKRMRLLFNKQDVPQEDRFALIPSDLMDFLLSDPDLLKRDKSLELDVEGGVVTRLYGFALMERSTANMFDNSATPVIKNPGVAGAATDNQGVFCWQKLSVEKAQGAVKTFYDIDKPEYFGSIFSMLVMMGGRNRRGDNKGVGSIVEAVGV